MTQRLVEPLLDDYDKSDYSLRPQKLSEYIGQENIKENLSISIKAAQGRNETLDHILFYGPPGLGKTTLANIIAMELNVNLKTSSGPVIEKQGDLAAILTNLNEDDVLFIDEIHRMNPSVEEILYPAMEDNNIDLIIGQGPGARSVKIDLPNFTLIGATTRAGLLTSPLRDRFGIIHRLDYYTHKELSLIISRSSNLLNIKMNKDACYEISKRSRGTPRIANRLLKRIRDYAQVKGDGVITLDIVNQSLDLLEVDELGFDKMDRKLLLTIINKFDGGPVGIETLAASISEKKDTIEDIYEPYLIQWGYMNRTNRGRVATKIAYEHFGIKTKDSFQSSLL